MRVVAIIPAFNEEQTIVSILQACLSSSVLSDIIVVDDGSTDHTAEYAQSLSVHVVQQENQGKGTALLAGAHATDADIILFLDADLVGLTGEHIINLVHPVMAGRAIMTVGLRDKSWFTHLAPRIAPVLGGERAIIRTHFLELAADTMRSSHDFGIETVMNAYCEKLRLPVEYIDMPGVHHVIKEKKYGIIRGFIARCKMIKQILWAEIQTYR